MDHPIADSDTRTAPPGTALIDHARLERALRRLDAAMPEMRSADAAVLAFALAVEYTADGRSPDRNAHWREVLRRLRGTAAVGEE